MRKFFASRLGNVIVLAVAAMIITGAAAKKFKIMHIMSYHSPWEWTDDQFRGFKSALQGLDIEYKVYQMDTKRNNSKEWLGKVSKKAIELINSWQPDLVYTNDDNAQKYVGAHFVNSEIPFVFSAVNSEPEAYGFTGAKNVTGVLERPHWVETIEFLKDIVPSIKKMAVISDNSTTFIPIMEMMKKNTHLVPDVEFVYWDPCDTFEQFKSAVMKYQDNVDAFVLLSAFTLKDDKGENVPWEVAYKWVVDNSRLPDCSFWQDRIAHGNMVGIAVSGYEQGHDAGKLARAILEEGMSPSELPMVPTRKGKPLINIKRANQLGIKVKSSALLTAEVLQDILTEVGE